MTTIELVSDRRATDRFFVWLATAMAAFALLAFAPTYWLQLPTGDFHGPPLLHLHGLLFSAWPLLVVSQAWLAAEFEPKAHRAFGLAGVALASLMVAVGLATAVAHVHLADAMGWGLSAREFLIVQVSGLLLFAGLVAAAIALARRGEWHHRLMLAATASLLQAPLGRIPFLIQHGMAPGQTPSDFPAPPLGLVTLPSLAVNLFLAVGVVYDIRTRGRPHPAWIVGLAAITAVSLLRWPLSSTSGWLAVAGWLAGAAG